MEATQTKRELKSAIKIKNLNDWIQKYAKFSSPYALKYTFFHQLILNPPTHVPKSHLQKISLLYPFSIFSSSYISFKEQSSALQKSQRIYIYVNGVFQCAYKMRISFNSRPRGASVCGLLSCRSVAAASYMAEHIIPLTVRFSFFPLFCARKHCIGYVGDDISLSLCRL